MLRAGAWRALSGLRASGGGGGVRGSRDVRGGGLGRGSENPWVQSSVCHLLCDPGELM